MKDWMLKEPAERKWEHSTEYFKKHNTARERFEQARGQERPTDGALAISDLEERIERKMEARYERKFEEQQKQFAMIVAECSKRIDDAPTTRRCAAAQISVADTSDDESDESEDETDDESVVETKTSRTRRIKQERSAAVAKRDAERKNAKKKANKAAKKKADKALAVAEEKKFLEETEK